MQAIINLIDYLQVYDARLSARASPQAISEEAQRRMKERKEWAERQREVSEKRMAEIKAQCERRKQELEAAKAKREKEAAMVAEMLKEMYRLNPEFAARREAVLQAGYNFFLTSCFVHLLTKSFASARRNENGRQCSIIFDLFDLKNTVFPLYNDIL
jgi:glutamyl-tRNA reductase